MNLVMKRQAPPIPDGLPGELGAVLGGCFAHSQEERSSAAEVAAAAGTPGENNPSCFGREEGQEDGDEEGGEIVVFIP